MAMGRGNRAARLDWLFFLGLWLTYGVFINSYDLEKFNLQQLGVESFVERGRLSVDGSTTPQLQPGGDVFAHDGHLFAAKQPGQFLAGAAAYAALHALGLSYGKNFLLVAALVTWWTASLATAAASLAVLRLARDWAATATSPLWPWLAALTFALGSTALPYAGVPHHDALATAYLTGALYCAWRLRTIARRHHAVLIGLLLGATVTTSMLPAPMVAVVAVYAVSMAWGNPLPDQAGGPALIALALGFAAGVTPLLLYNWHYFGHPLLVPNVAGNFADTFPFFAWSNLGAKLGFYATMLSLYVPVAWCGLAGLTLFPAALRREQLLIVAMLAGLAGYVCNIETLGGCQYGPRYLLPAMPLLALGLIGFSYLRSNAARRVAAVVATLLAVASGTVNAVGALYGAMYCDLRQYGFIHNLTALRLGIVRTSPLALWLTIPIGAWTVAVVRAIENARRQ
jgi:hypothetical protein